MLSARTCIERGFITFDEKKVHLIDEEELTLEQLLNQYRSTFKGLGSLGSDYELTLKDDAVPVVHAPRRVPITLKKKLKDTLDELVLNKVIAPVKEPTDWVSSLVVAEKKNGKLRVCIDPKDLNNNLKRSHYPLPTLDEIIPDLNKCKVFSTFDCRNGYWQVALSEETSYLTTFNSPFGRYRWLRMPFGLSSASEEY